MSTHPFWQQTGLDISGEPDENDVRSLAEVEAFARSDRYVEPTQQTTETFLRMREEATASVSSFRWEMQEELAREGERIGRIMAETEFINLLNTIVTARYNEWSARGMRGLSILVGERWKYVCAVQCGYMPEYSVMRFDDHGLPSNEKYRGWRTVLLRLIMGGFISEERAHAIFGMPEIGPASRRYRKYLWVYRNRKVS